LQKQNMADTEEPMESNEMETTAQTDVNTSNAECQESVEKVTPGKNVSEEAGEGGNIRKISITVKTPQDKKVVRVSGAANTKEVIS
jgi:hypothetical protein